MRANPSFAQAEPCSPAALTAVELTWLEKRVEHWIRFGRDVGETIIDRRRRVLSFAPNTIFAFVRWASNDFGTVVSRIDIVRSVTPGEAYQTLPFVRPGGEILLRISGWPKVERVFAAIDAIESSRYRPHRCGARSLATRPQSPRHRIRAATLQPRPASRLALAEGAVMTRFGYVMTAYFASLGIGASAIFRPLPRLIWNASASVPIGLYAVHPAGALHVSELVVVQPPEGLASFLDERRYLPRGVPMLKRVLALPGQTVCRTDRANRRRRDHHGRCPQSR